MPRAGKTTPERIGRCLVRFADDSPHVCGARAQGLFPVGNGHEAAGLRVFFAGVASTVFRAALAAAFVDTAFFADLLDELVFVDFAVAVVVSVTEVSF